MGRKTLFTGTIGTCIVKVFDMTVAATGSNEKNLSKKNIPYISSHTHSGSHASYYPGAEMMAIKLIFSPSAGKTLGAQIVGVDGVDKRIDVLATAIKGGLTVYDLEELELAYAPPYGSARDPVNIIGFVASNMLRGDSKLIYWDEIETLDNSTDFLLDVRYPEEVAAGALDGAVNIPLSQLRDRLDEIPRDRRIVVYCQAGQRAYYAYRILVQNGYEATNLCGGYKTYSHAVGQQSNFDIFWDVPPSDLR